MKRLSVCMLIMLLVVSMSWVVGCRSPQSPAENDNTVSDLMTRDENPNFNDAFGGYNMKDESPAFGDPQLLDEFDESGDVEYDDPFSRDTDLAEMDRPDRRRLFLAITWGNLHRDSTITNYTDWKGSLSIDNGAILLKRTIRFEGDDKILPRTSRNLLEWESMTRPHYDGVLVRVFAKCERDNDSTVVDTVPKPCEIDSANVLITFDTGPVKVEFTLKELPNLNRTITLDDGNAVAFHAVMLPPGRCIHGPARGVWRNHPERQGGIFQGRWATADGAVQGFLRGRYGVNDAGEKVFFGKMIDTNGRFEGIMRGRWGHNPAIANGGWFAGHWVDRNLNIHGGIAGEWRRSNRCHGGFFRAVWGVNCLSVSDG